MNGQAIAAIATAGIMLLGMLGGVLSLTFRMGNLSGQIISFMATTSRDRAEILTELGKLDGRLERHVAQHDRANRQGAR